MRRFLWVGMFFLLLGSAVVVLVHSLREGSRQVQPDSADGKEVAKPLLVGFGYVDVEGGTLPLSPAAIGLVKEVLVKEGQLVQANDPLLKLESDGAARQVEMATAAVMEARVRLAQARRSPQKVELDLQLQEQAIAGAQANVNVARQETNRAKDLLASSLISKETYATALSKLEAIEAALKAEQLRLAQLRLRKPEEDRMLAEAALANAESQRERAVIELNHHTLRAPEEGTVLRINAGAGQVLTAQQTVPAVWFAPNKPFEVRCELNQDYARWVEKGQAVELFDDFDGASVGTGTVRHISPWITHRRSLLDEPLERNDIRTLECIVRPDSALGVCPIGKRLRVMFRSAGPDSSLSSRK